MAIKQHCDICDSVIPGEDSFRVIRYGRGQNLDVQTGLEPKIICKSCWGKMWAAVSTEEVKNIDNIGTDFLSKAEARRYKKAIDKNSDAINDINGILADIIPEKKEFVSLSQVRQLCTTCIYSDKSPTEEPCFSCAGCNRWRPKDETQSDV